MRQLQTRQRRSFRPRMSSAEGQYLEVRSMLTGEVSPLGTIVVDIAPTDAMGERIDRPHGTVTFEFMSDDTYTATVDIGEEEDVFYYEPEFVEVSFSAEPQLQGNSKTTSFQTGLVDLTQAQVDGLSNANLNTLAERYQKAFDREMELQKQALDTATKLRALAPTDFKIKMGAIEFPSLIASTIRDKAARLLNIGEGAAIEVSTRLAVLHLAEAERLRVSLNLLVNEQNDRILNPQNP